MDPINYRLDVQNPIDTALKGMQLGAGISGAIDARQERERQLALQAQMQQDFGAFSNRINSGQATGQDFTGMIAKYPQLADNFKKGWDILGPEQQQARSREMSQVFAAVQNGQPQVAYDLINQFADGYQNVGKNQDAQSLRQFGELIKSNPEAAKTTLGLNLAYAMGPDKFESNYGALLKTPADASTAESNAVIKGVEAKNAPINTALTNEKTASEIDLNKTKRQLELLNVQIAQANNQTDRAKLELERKKLEWEMGKAEKEQKDKIQQTPRALQSSLDSSYAAIDNVDKILNHPGLKSSFGLGGIGSATGAISSWIPGTEAKDIRVLIDSLKSKQALNALAELKSLSASGASGLGSTTEKELDLLINKISSLDPNQSKESFVNSLGEIKANYNKIINQIVANGNLPTQGGGYLMTLPSGQHIFEGDVNRLMVQHPGASRDQVLQYLRSQGAKNGSSK